MSIDINAAKAVIDRSMSQLAGFNGPYSRERPSVPSEA
jgi:hypothetical protein